MIEMRKSDEWDRIGGNTDETKRAKAAALLHCSARWRRRLRGSVILLASDLEIDEDYRVSEATHRFSRDGVRLAV